MMMIDNTQLPVMLDDSHIVSHIVFESKPNVFHVDLASFSDYDDFPDVINTAYGNQKLFYLYKVMYNKHDHMYTAVYKQPDSRAVLLVYNQ